jgi:carbon-monoxide dehydrogenase large subunit
MARHGIGAAVARKEDRRFTTGNGRYVADLVPPGALRAVFLRSPHAHAGVAVADTQAALAVPGVVAVLTGADMAADGIGTLPTQWSIPEPDGTPMFVPPYPGLAADTVRFVGNAYAMVIARSEAVARDAAELVEVDFEERPAAATLERAAAPGAPVVWPQKPDNTSLWWTNGDRAAAQAAFARAVHVVDLHLVNSRLAPSPVEPRIALGRYDAGRDHMSLVTSTQCPHEVQAMLARAVFGVPETRLDVIAPDVGGGFGTKAYLYPEEVAVLWAARRLGRDVLWQGDRIEAFLADAHARDHITHARLALDGDGRFLALEVKTTANMGAYLSQHAPAVPTVYSTYVLPGPYDFGAVFAEIRNVFSHSAPLDAYRGAGRSEGVYVTERIVEEAARRLGIDAAELRARNLVAPAAMPYVTATGSRLDSGDGPALLAKVCALADRAGFADRREASRVRGRLRGMGLAMYAANCGGCASPDNMAVGSLGGNWESARLRLHPTGTATLYLGTHNHGQGHETAFSQIVSELTGLAFEDIEVVFGSTATVQRGIGTFASRSAVVAGPAAMLAANKVIAKGRLIAAHLMEAAPVDVEFSEGSYRIAGTDRAVSLSEVAMAAYVPHNFPHETLEPGLDETGFFDPADFTWPMGAHAAEVEIDPETGYVQLLAYAAADDFGTVINPMIVEGQLHGAIAQGAGQALWEKVSYDGESGQLLTGSFMDYGMPRSDLMPSMALAQVATRASTNPLGAKGAGEAGTFAAPAAVMNAVLDALSQAGVGHLDMPATPDRIWHALQAARG